jgi:hypothetical protein
VLPFERFEKPRDTGRILVLNVGMAKTSSSAHTAPKGHATRTQGRGGEGRSLFGPALQWILVVVAGLAILGGIMYVGRDVRSNLGGGGGHGAPAEVLVGLNADPLAA